MIPSGKYIYFILLSSLFTDSSSEYLILKKQLTIDNFFICYINDSVDLVLICKENRLFLRLFADKMTKKQVSH